MAKLIQRGFVSVLLFSVAFAASAVDYYPENCKVAFGLTSATPLLTLPSPPVLLIPALPTSNDKITMCYLGGSYSDYTAIDIVGNKVTFTVFDTGFSWSPNPIIILGQDLGPLAAGDYVVDVILTSAYPDSRYPILVATGLPLSISQGAALPTGQSQNATEFYNRTLDHYFLTAAQDEMEKLDSGYFAGWSRTGHSLNLEAAAQGNPVCRFYIPPSVGDSHFYSASPAECTDVAARFPQFIAESANVFRITMPDPSGNCAPDHVAVYRLWNGRKDSNHRYVVDRGLRDQMVEAGYVAEGYGPYAVSMCMPK